MNGKMLFLRIGWMNRYRGLDGDRIQGGGGDADKVWYEIFNFQPFNRHYYGYVGVQRRAPSIEVNHLGAAGADHVPGILVVWVATSPNAGEGMRIVGWYRNATVYREYREPPRRANRRHDGHDCGYFVTAASDRATLLSPDERTFEVGGMGRINIWYAASHEDFRNQVYEYIRERSEAQPDHRNGRRKPIDPARRRKIELKAVEITTAHYKGWTVNSVERDNKGWDLNAVRGSQKLKLEVKGLSGSAIAVELTPNEYKKMRKHRETYKICVVTRALEAPTLTVFSFKRANDRWESRDGRILDIKEATGARCRA